MPEQEYLPPRPPGGPDGPGPPGEVPPPWANLSPVRPARPRPGGLGDGPGDAARVSAGYPMGSWQTEGAVTPQDAVPSAGPRPQEQLPPWAGPDADDEEPSAAPPRRNTCRALNASFPRPPSVVTVARGSAECSGGFCMPASADS